VIVGATRVLDSIRHDLFATGVSVVLWFALLLAAFAIFTGLRKALDVLGARFGMIGTYTAIFFSACLLAVFDGGWLYRAVIGRFTP